MRWWIPINQDMRSHYKIQRLTRLLGVSVAEACGLMQLLWSWAAQYAPDGNISDFDAADIAYAAGWDKDPQIFYDALLSIGGTNHAGFIERLESGEIVIHDWYDHDHTGAYLEKRDKNRERMRNSRTDTARAQNVQGGEGVPSTHVHEQFAHVQEHFTHVHPIEIEREKEKEKSLTTRARDD